MDSGCPPCDSPLANKLFLAHDRVHLPLVVAALARPSPVLADLTSRGHNGPSAVASGTAHLPSQVAHKHQDDLGNAAFRVAFGTESMAAGVEEGM